MSLLDLNDDTTLLLGSDTADAPIAAPECRNIFCYNTATSGASWRPHGLFSEDETLRGGPRARQRCRLHPRRSVVREEGRGSGGAAVGERRRSGGDERDGRKRAERGVLDERGRRWAGPPEVVVMVGRVVSCPLFAPPAHRVSAPLPPLPPPFFRAGQSIITGLWVDALLGVLFYLLFVAFYRTFPVYRGRLTMGGVAIRPPPVDARGFRRFFAWLGPVLRIQDHDFLRMTSLDALATTRVIAFGILLLIPLTVLGIGMLLPLNYTAQDPTSEGSGSSMDAIFLGMTISNVPHGSPRLWAHFSYVYFAVLWAVFLLRAFHNAHIAALLRAEYGPGPRQIEQGEEEQPQGRGAEQGEEDGQDGEAQGASSPGQEQGQDPSGLAASRSLSPSGSLARRRATSFPGGVNALDDEVYPVPGQPFLGRTVFTAPQDAADGRSSPAGRADPWASALGASAAYAAGAGAGGDPFAAAAAYAAAAASGGGLPGAAPGGADAAGPGAVADPRGTWKDASARAPLPGAPDEVPGPRQVQCAFGVPAPPHPGRYAVLIMDQAERTYAFGGRGTLPGATELKDRYAEPSPRPAIAKIPSAGNLSAGRAAPGTAPSTPSAAAAHGPLGGGLAGRVWRGPVPWSGAFGATFGVAFDPTEAGPAQGRSSPHKWRRGMGLWTEGGKKPWDQEADVWEAPDAAWVKQEGLRQAHADGRPDAQDGGELASDAQAGAGDGEPPRPRPEPAGSDADPSSADAHDAFSQLALGAPAPPAPPPASTARAPTLSSPEANVKRFGETKRMAAARVAFEEVFGDDFLGLVPAARSKRVDSLLSKQFGLRCSWQRAARLARKAQRELDIAEGKRSPSAPDSDDERERALETSPGPDGRGATPLQGGLRDGLHRTTSAKAGQPGHLEVAARTLSGGHPELELGARQAEADAAGALGRGAGAEAAPPAAPAGPSAGPHLAAASPRRIRALRRRATKAASRADALAERLDELAERIRAERERARAGRPPGPFFALFRTQAAAAYASTVNINPPNRNLMRSMPSPDPSAINWSALSRGWLSREVRPVLTMPLTLLVMLFPIGIFSGGFTQLTAAICHNKDQSAVARGFCSDGSAARFARGLVTGVLPSLLLSIYQGVVLPNVFYLIALVGAQHVSLQSLDESVGGLFFLWTVFNQFLGALLGGSIISGIRTFVQSPAKIWRLLGSAVPASSNFFVLYVVFRAFAMLPLRLFWPSSSVLGDIFRFLGLLRPAVDPYERVWTRAPRNQRSSYDVGINVMSVAVPVLAYSAVTPIILPFGLLYFFFTWAVWRYQSLYVFESTYDARGRVWPYFAQRAVVCLFIQVVFTSAMLIVKAAYIQAGVMLPTLSVLLYSFSRYLHRFDAVAESQPLWSKHEAPEADLSPELFLPVPLRDDADLVWHPGWGKAWQYWAVPRYGF